MQMLVAMQGHCDKVTKCLDGNGDPGLIRDNATLKEQARNQKDKVWVLRGCFFLFIFFRTLGRQPLGLSAYQFVGASWVLLTTQNHPVSKRGENIP